METRFVVPVAPVVSAPRVAQRLNPIFTIQGKDCVLLTQAGAAVRRRELGPVLASLADCAFEITGALDVLISGV